MALSKKDILSVELKTKEFEVPELNGTVIIQELSAFHGDRIEVMYAEAAQSKDYKDLIGLTASLVAWSLVDDEGNRIFEDDEIKDVQKLGRKAINRIALEVRKFNDIDDEGVEEEVKKS